LTQLSKRKANNVVRHPWLLVTTFGATLATAIFMGLVYSSMGRMTPGIQDRFASFFFTVLYLSLASLTSLPVWQEERILVQRERAAGLYSAPAYVVCTVAFDLLTMRVLPTVFLATAAYSMMGLRKGLEYRLQYWLAVTVCNVASAAASMLVGALAPSTSVANAVASLAVLVNLLFSGFLLSLRGLPWPAALLSRLSYVRYAYEILVVNEFSGVHGYKLTPFAAPGQDPDTLPFKTVTGDEVLQIFYFEKDRAVMDMWCLVGLAVTYTILIAVALHWKGGM
jgi:ATP-binding cassette subfamily G (WHITE) protein 2